MNTIPATVDEYIASFPPEVQAVLRAVRATVHRAAPQAEERISYRMPALFQSGVVVYFGAFKNHLGLFPPVEDPALRVRVEAFAGSKGNLQFPYSQSIPHELIAAVVQARLKSNLAKLAAKRPSVKSSSAKRPARSRSAA
ncbi:iron chaperone [Piscinibacter defluvii]|uniref:iron chaperone n=1 Tax=Piscinibacter defluvii TaxID=1796922 RepID=UPI000FDE9595|nr:DUF1801 domain-containing protein [Piscinibacter defluvii]